MCQYFQKHPVFRIGKTNMNILLPKFKFSIVEFPYEGKKLAAYAEEMPTTILPSYGNSKKKLVVKYPYLF